MKNYGKDFEAKFKSDWIRTLPQGVIIRIYDTTNGFKSISNLCDFIGYADKKLFLLECKSHAGASIPFTAISQYDKLSRYVGIDGVRVGIIVWLHQKDMCMYVPVKTIKQLIADGEKSVGIRHLDNYDIKVLPSVKKRTYLDTDYSVLTELPEGW